MPTLNWLDKTVNTTPKVPCRILRVDDSLSYGAAIQLDALGFFRVSRVHGPTLPSVGACAKPGAV